MNYLNFEFKGTSESGKTKRWVVNNSSTGAILGWIEWHAPWRKYWFCPINATGFDADCMQQISDFLRGATVEQRG